MNQRFVRVGLLTLGLLLVAESSWALPQFAIRSPRACDTCHVAPTGWVDPEVSLRKCSLNCNVCHVSPSGGGMRNESGIFYGRRTLPMFGRLPADKLEMAAKMGKIRVPSSQPMSNPFSERSIRGPKSSNPSSQPTSQPTRPPSSQPSSQAVKATVASSQPSSQPAKAAVHAAVSSSQPASTSQPAGSQPIAGAPNPWPTTVPAPGTKERYAGIEPHPTYQIGGDLRLALYAPFEDGKKTAFFPMQTDLYFAVRPYNPKDFNEGRLTLLVSGGALGSRDEEFDGFHERFFVREWYAMYHDLPYQMYARVGRFLPAHGWRTDDHTPFIRQGQMIFGSPFDHERQVTGLEVGLNPNYPYLHLSVFNPANDWDKPIDFDNGFGTAISAGYRELGWHAGGSVIYGSRGELDGAPGMDQVAVSAQWAANLYVLTDIIPLIYMGEFHVNNMIPETGRNTTGLSAFHELGWLIIEGLNTTLRYDWGDSDIELMYDSMHRLSFGFEWYPVQFLEVVARYRHNWRHTDDRFSAGKDEILLMLHGWY